MSFFVHKKPGPIFPGIIFFSLIQLIMLYILPITAHAAEESVTYPIYHVHTGNSDSGGGCYNIQCSGSRDIEIPCGGTLHYWGDSWGTSECNRCGASYHGDRGGEGCPHSETRSESYTYYEMGCGYGSGAVVGYVTYTRSTSDWCKDFYIDVSYESHGMGVASNPYIQNGTAYDNGHFHITENGNYTFSLATDGNSSSGGAVYSVNVSNIDVTAPMIVSYLLDPSCWVKEGVRLTMLDVRDPQPDGSDGSGLDSSPYSYDNGTSWTSDTSHLYTQNGTYSVMARDKVGNTTTTTFTISNIDNEAPRILNCDYDHSPNRRSVTIELTCDDVMADGRTGAGLDPKPYSYDGGQTWSTSPCYSTEQNKTIHICVRDRLGNVAEHDVTIDNIDDHAPQISHELSKTTWTKDPVTVIFSAIDKNPDGSDGIGLPEDCYSYDGGRTWSSDGNITVNDNQRVSVVVRDKNGNKAYYSMNVTNIDITAPTVVAYTLDPTDWVKEGVTLSLDDVDDIQPTGTPGCGLHSRPYSYDGGQTWTYRSTQFYEENGDYKVLIRDRLLNTLEFEFTIGNIDHEAPRILSCDYDHTDNLRTLEVVADCDDIMADGRNGCGLADMPYSYDGGQTWTDENRLYVDHNISFTFIVKDKLGNTSSKEFNIENIDDYPPVVTHSVSTEEWTTESIEVILDSSDDKPNGQPGIGLPDECYSFDGGQTWTDDPKIIVDDNCVLDILVKDKNDNTTGYSIEISNIDFTSPTVVEYTLDPPVDWIKEGVTFTIVEINDNQPDGRDGCGLDDKPFSYDGGLNWCDEYVHLYEDNGDYTVLSRDKLGNITETSFTISNIDHEEPRILKFEYDDTKNLRQTTLTVECDDMLSDGRVGSGLDIQPYSYDGGATWTDATTRTYNGNGRVDFAVRDKLGNIAQRSIVIDFIDEYSPSVRHDLYPGYWTNGDVEVSFDAVDINPDGTDGVGLPDNCFSYDSGDSWTDDDSISVEDNGEVKVAVRDRHGNTEYYSLTVTNIDKVAPVITASCELIAKGKAAMLSAYANDDSSGINQSSFKWSGPESGSGSVFIAGLDGVYTVTVSDNAGNTAEASVTVSGVIPSLIHPGIDRLKNSVKSVFNKSEKPDNEKKETVEKIMPKISEKGKDTTMNDLDTDNSHKSLSQKIKDWWNSLSTLQKALIILCAAMFLAGMIFLIWLWYRSVAIYCELGDDRYKFLGFGCIHIRSGNLELKISESAWDHAETTHFKIVCNLLFVAFHRGEMLYVYFPEDQVKGGKIAHKMDIMA